MADDDRSKDLPFPDMPPFLTADAFSSSSTVQVDFGGRSQRGKLHTVNEDHYLIVRLGRHQETLMTSLPDGVIPKRYEEYGYAMVVADGMGGASDGEIASRVALATLTHLVLYYGRWSLRIDDRIAQEIRERVERFYKHVDLAMADEGRIATSELHTSLTAAFGAGRHLFFAHVGHSRAYLFRDGGLMRLTRDHTIGRRRSATAPVAPVVNVNVAARDLKHALTQTIGMGGSGPQVDLETFQVDDGDVVLVCTNGLSDVVNEKVLAMELASDRSADDHCQMLMEMAAGSEDDVTALVARYHIPQ